MPPTASIGRRDKTEPLCARPSAFPRIDAARAAEVSRLDRSQRRAGTLSPLSFVGIGEMHEDHLHPDHTHPRERERIESLVQLTPLDATTVLDVGARDGCVSCPLADRGAQVTAVDLDQPTFVHPRVTTGVGDARHLAFADRSFNLVVCSEVLEHIAPDQLPRIASEFKRVAANYILIGVPFEQDLRVGRTVCRECGAVNPPWGHVNSFGVAKLDRLFSGFRRERVEYVGSAKQRTNSVSAALYAAAGFAYGTYEQLEPCIQCGAALAEPPAPNLLQRATNKAAHLLDVAWQGCTSARPLWVHVLYTRH